MLLNKDMKKIKLLILISVGICGLQGCSSGGDYSTELSGGYFFRDEGTDIHDILSHQPSGREIPANVVSYSYNNAFIIAAQKPNKVDDPLYGKTPNYKEGRGKVYYWLVYHSKNLFLGPMSKTEFVLAKKKYKVPEDLKLDLPYEP